MYIFYMTFLFVFYFSFLCWRLQFLLFFFFFFIAFFFVVVLIVLFVAPAADYLLLLLNFCFISIILPIYRLTDSFICPNGQKRTYFYVCVRI